jgi:hypothetical protein
MDLILTALLCLPGVIAFIIAMLIIAGVFTLAL